MSVPSCFARLVLGFGQSRAASLRRLAAQLSSLATLEDAVAHGVQALLEVHPEPVVPIPATGPAPPSPTSAPARALVPLCPRPLPAVLGIPFCSTSAAPRPFPSRALPWPRLTVRFLLAATPAPRPLLPALSSYGVWLAWPEAPHRPSRVLQLLITPVRGVVPQVPLKHDNAGGTSTAAGCGVTPNDRCGARCSVKHQRAVQCGLAAPTPRPMMTTTTRATPCCSCSPTPSSRPLYLRASLRWTSSWWPYLVAFALDIFTTAQQDLPRPEPDLNKNGETCEWTTNWLVQTARGNRH